MAQKVRICMLNADVPVPNVVTEKAPTYGRIFHQLLEEAATRKCPHVHIESSDYDVKKLEYPSSLRDFDVIIISGSASSAYDDDEWVHQLNEYIRHVYENEPHIKIFGSCFGHQIICQSLLKKYGVIVCQDPQGWELGVHNIKLESKFLKALAEEGASDQLKLQFVHHDHVVVPNGSLPGSWMTVGSTQHCAVQGVYEPGRVLTYQGHFEFDRFVNSETIKFFFPNWDPKALEEALKLIDADDDAKAAADMVLKFSLDQEKGDGLSFERRGGLLTPPSQE